MSDKSKEMPEILPEVMPVVVNMSQVQELHDFAVKALESLRKQHEEISVAIERQIGLVSAFEILLGGKAEETLQQVREAISKASQNGVPNGNNLPTRHPESQTNGAAPH